MSFAASVLVGGAAVGTGGLLTLLRRTFIAGLTVQAVGCACVKRTLWKFAPAG